MNTSFHRLFQDVPALNLFFTEDELDPVRESNVHRLDTHRGIRWYERRGGLMKTELRGGSGDGEDLSFDASSVVDEWVQLGLSPSAARLG